jgi:serine O-acetyltransferase
VGVVSTVRAGLAQFPALVVWGAGGLGRTALARWLPSEKVVAIVDTNPGRQAERVLDLPVEAPSTAVLSRGACLVICASAVAEIHRELDAMGYSGPRRYIYELMLPPARSGPLRALAVDVAVARNAPWLPFLFQKPQIMLNVSFRVGQWLRNRPFAVPLFWLAYAWHHINCVLLGIQLPLTTSIGPGLNFAHFGTIVFSSRATIGACFTIYHGCTVGTNDSGEAPVIGDFVTQYAGSHVLGRSRLADRARIGANAVALDLDVAEGQTAVGIPARIVSRVA